MNYTLDTLEELMKENKGNLNLKGAEIDSLPSKLIVPGECDFSDSTISELPEYLVVFGDLYIENTNISKIPKTLIVKGDLWMKNTSIPIKNTRPKIPNGVVSGCLRYNLPPRRN